MAAYPAQILVSAGYLLQQVLLHSRQIHKVIAV